MSAAGPRSPAARVARGVAAGLPRRIDWVLLLSSVTLAVLGVVLVASATADPGTTEVRADYVQRHLVHLAAGVVCCLLVAALDYRTPKSYASIVYVAAAVGLLLVITPLGETINGSRGWLVVGGLQMQPAEFAKVGVILTVAMLLGEPRDGEHAPTSRDVLLALAALALPLGLILTQPDLGTALVLGSVFLAMLALSGAPLAWIAALIGAGCAAVVAVFWFDLLEPYQLDRLATLMDPTADPQGAGYNANQALIAVGSGGVSGKGLFQGEQTSGRFVPEQHTDFVFTVAGEELGFLGAGAIIVLLAVVVLRVLAVAAQCESPYGRLVCVGVAAWIMAQSMINIGMTLGVMPVTGLPLPLVSYGGSAAVAQLVSVGLVLGIHARDRGFEG